MLRFPPHPIVFLGDGPEEFVVYLLHPLTFDQIHVHVQRPFDDARLCHHIESSIGLVESDQPPMIDVQ